jgi:hypothetical protein
VEINTKRARDRPALALRCVRSCCKEDDMTMKAELLTLLKKQWVTPLVALREVNCLSLSQRCGELERSGVRIQRQWRNLPNGKRVRAYRVG